MTRARVWFNLHKRVWSVGEERAPVCHRARVALVGVTFKVSESGRLRVIAKRCREVHARAHGTLTEHLGARPADAVRVTYNPYRGPTFTVADTGAPVITAAAVWFETDGTAWATLES